MPFCKNRRMWKGVGNPIDLLRDLISDEVRTFSNNLMLKRVTLATLLFKWISCAGLPWWLTDHLSYTQLWNQEATICSSHWWTCSANTAWNVSRAKWVAKANSPALKCIVKSVTGTNIISWKSKSSRAVNWPEGTSKRDGHKANVLRDCNSTWKTQDSYKPEVISKLDM